MLMSSAKHANQAPLIISMKKSSFIQIVLRCSDGIRGSLITKDQSVVNLEGRRSPL